MGLLRMVLKALIFDFAIATILGGGARSAVARTAAVVALGMILPFFVIGHRVAKAVIEPAPSYMHDEVVMPPPAPIQQTYLRHVAPHAEDSAFGFDAVIGR